MRARNVSHSLTVLALAVGASRLPAQSASAPSDSTPRVSIDGFVDSYYAWDFGRPLTRDRSFVGGAAFTTQPARHNEFNVNLAFVALKLEAPHYRGRLALQAGTSVQSNYAGEPTVGAISGPSLSRVVQEATVGVQLATRLWIDAGIMFSHMGMEGWISRDNPTYTRSLVAEYSPYYQNGARLTWLVSPRVVAQLNVVNGWQNIAENNEGKGVGARVDVQATASTSFSYYNFLGAEQPRSFRMFHGIGVRRAVGRLSLLGELDAGTQSRESPLVAARWVGGTAIARVQMSARTAIIGRVEAFSDPDQVVISTGSVHDAANSGFRGTGGSLGIDVAPYARVQWRGELRLVRADRSLFPSPDGGARERNALAVTSLSLTF